MRSPKLLLVLIILTTCCYIAHAQYTAIYSFTAEDSGSQPRGSLFSDGTWFYGTTSDGGANNHGTIFRVMIDGSNFQKLFDFNGAGNGRDPHGDLISDGTWLYGSTFKGGTLDDGVVYRFMPDGSAFEVVHEHGGDQDGIWQRGGVATDGEAIFGLTERGGIYYHGTIYKVMPDGTGFQKLHDFNESVDGKYPAGSLYFDGTYFYGMTEMGGTSDAGTIFRILPDGTGFETLMHFDGTNGLWPKAEFISDGTYLYGTTYSGGAEGLGVVFRMLPDGSEYSVLWEFDELVTGRAPRCNMVLVGDYLYGMTEYGGTDDDGTIFRVRNDGTDFSKLEDFVIYTDGNSPQHSLIYDGTFFYGTNYQGGEENDGVIFKFQYNAPSGVTANTAASDLQIAPNPFATQTVIRRTGGFANASICVYDTYGRLQKRFEQVTGEQWVLDRNDLAAGVYTVVVESDGKSSRKKLVVCE